MSILAKPYTLPLRIRYRWAKGDHDTRSGLLVRCDIDGAIGWGEVAFGPHVAVDGPVLAKELSDLVAGLDIHDDGFLDAVSARRPHNRIRCGIATAWLSARATRAELPLNRFLAPERTPADAVPINGLINELTPAGVVEQAHGYTNQGMTTFKIKCFEDVERDLLRVRTVRSEFPDADLRLDPNDAWKTPTEALRNMERFSPLRIDYVEDPLDTHQASLADMAEVARYAAFSVAWDNPVEDLAAMKRLLDAEAVHVFVFKMPRAGGPDRQLAMLDLAEKAGKRGVMTGPLESAVGTMAGLHVASLTPPPLPHCGFSLSGHFAQDVGPLPAINDGQQAIGDRPGLGIDIGQL